MPGSHVVLIDGNASGILKVSNVDEDWVYIAEIQLLPEHQGRGLGTQILEDIMAAAETANQSVELQVLTVNPAKRLYERTGFKVSHEKMYWHPPGRP